MTATHFLRNAFCACVLILAAWRFSENTADPDLWGHVIFGQRMLELRQIEKAEPFSWTAPNHEWVNHEVGAELIMGAAHKLLGGPGLLLLALAAGFFTFLFALKMGSEGLSWPQRALAWGIAVLAAREIAFGFSVRPQIFTSVSLVVMLWLLRKGHSGKLACFLALPPLFVLWINTHGGALAGFCLLVAAAVATGFQFVLGKLFSSERFNLEKVEPLIAAMINWTTVLSLMGLCFNPWKVGLIKWLIGSVSWFRPEISEWNPPSVGFEHAGMFALIPISVFAFAMSRRKRWLWEIAVVAALALVSVRHARHIPLFCIAVLAIVPPHLADALARFESAFANLVESCKRSAVQQGLAVLLVLASLAMAYATVTHGKTKFYTMEVPRQEYPNAAIEFIREHDIKGNMISFFDWGEQCIWELPESRVSIDGRLDTCYSRELLREHWNFFEGKPVDPKVFDINQADFALLRTDVVVISILETNANWIVAYRDPLSIVFVREPARFPKLAAAKLPVTRTGEVLVRRDPFPNALSASASVK